ncbi:ArsR/SmtB family transcription factor [Nocardioides aurantiacus]|uniref:ArsR/SmtB family transcription factor n=1 Tax=Nocardioides aurantiacus TaxID=86796 RepID=UPI00403F1348
MGAEAARALADILQTLATPSRLLILDRLRTGPLTVGEIATSVGMEQSAVSHQLRHLREHGFVDAERHGRHISYRLVDDHVVELIDQASAHAEHLEAPGGSVDHVPAGVPDAASSAPGRRPPLEPQAPHPEAQP